ncbi:TolC family protein [Arundinibacter roseus]|uniref:TolC family protein n=1 Tax=Arundinibacter roseus TaxID=2070510 RepID=A0A4R4K8X7_9BACT|nr:TolC family protein [Arundinibacter roseus]TDB64080.1 TolC family protein [Arundinibacter roseus]
MVIKKFYFVLLGCMVFFPAVAQRSDILEEYVREGLEKNLSLQQETLEIARVAENIRQARALFYPQVTFAPTYSLAAGGRRLQFPVGDLLNPVYSTLNEMTQSNRFPQIQNVDEQLAPNNFHDTKISFQYSIYNPEIQYNYLIQQNLLSAQEAKKKVVANELRYTIETAYYQYAQTLEASRIFENSLRVMQELIRLNQKLVANNVVTKDAVLSAEYEFSKLDQQLAEATKNQQIAQAYFNFILNRNLQEPIAIDTALPGKLSTTNLTTSDLSGLTGEAVQDRQELKQLDYSITAAQNALRMQEVAGRLPSVFVGGNTGFQGFGYTFSGQAYLVAQVGLSWDLFKGYERKSRTQQAKIQTDVLKVKHQEVERQIALQVTQAYYELMATRQNLRATEVGLSKASQYFQVIDSRYRNGNVLLIEFIKAQNDLLTARLQQSLSRYDVLIKTSLLNKTIYKP